MNIEVFAKPLTGKTLETKMHSKVVRNAIAEGLLYEQTALMVAADPGAGKSTVSTQIAVELAAGIPLFGFFHVPRPMKVLYIQTERSIIEFLERLKVIEKTYPIVYENLMLTDEYQKLNLLNPRHVDVLVECLKRDVGQADVVFIDPIYSTVAGGLSGDVPASAFTRVMSRIQKELNCCLYYNHHTIKPTYSTSGEKIEKDDPFYGSQWLKAHVTGSYHMKSNEEGVILICKKDNYRLLLERIALEYDPETELCHVDSDKLSADDRLQNFLNLRRIDGRQFTFKEIQKVTNVCTRRLRELVMHTTFQNQVKSVSGYKNKKIYQIRGVDV